MKVTWNDRVRNEEVLHSDKEERNNLRTVKRRRANRIRHILRRNCLPKHVIERKMEGRREVTGRRGRRRKQLLDLNVLTPNVNYSGRTATLTSKVTFYMFMQQI